MLRREPPPVVNLPPLEVRAESLDFGDVVEASNYRHEIPVRNASSNPMTVRFTKSCDCAGIEPEVLRLQPGETGRILLRLDLLHDRARYIGHARRPFAAHVGASWGDTANDRLPMAVFGKVRAILAVWPPNLHVRDGLIEGEDGKEEVVEVKTIVPLGRFGVKDCPPRFRVRIEPADEGYRVFVRPLAGLRPGRHESAITFDLADAKGLPLPAQILPLTVCVTGLFVVTPAETMIGMRSLDSVAEQIVRVQGRGTPSFSVVEVEPQDDNTQVAPVGTADGVVLYRVRVRIAKPGAQREMLSFVVRDARGKLHTASHVFTYYGTRSK